MKIKSSPEDFYVEEKVALPLAKKGEYTIFRLTKSGWNTLDTLKRASYFYNIPMHDINYGGRKDRHAQTIQYVSLKNAPYKPYSEDAFSFEPIGYLDRPMGPDLIEANDFQIKIHSLTLEQIQKSQERLDVIQQFGFINYFDDQRFGSFHPTDGFLAKKILLGHLAGAVKIYLTLHSERDSSDDKARKQFFIENWKDWGKCLTKATTEEEINAFTALQKNTQEVSKFLTQIPEEEMRLFYSAYQSYIWNEVVARFIEEEFHDDVSYIKGTCNAYCFPNQWQKNDENIIAKLELPTFAKNAKMPTDLTKKIYQEILNEEGITVTHFNRLKIRQAFFKSTLRSLTIVPENLKISFERKANLATAVVNFSLPRGCYATMLLKQLFSES